MSFFKSVIDFFVDTVENTAKQNIKKVDQWERKNGGSSEKSEAYREKMYDNLDKVDDFRSRYPKED
ncbi:MAG: hypothetical protein EKK64_01365 [Neisseriaceae bacterium]|nr:MAG: hypothetical protein EKK64_01365 [Neisseriaceae bacterium]